MFKIAQRRYLGNKNAILPFIDKIIKSEISNFKSLCDIFAGTGVVGDYFNTAKISIISNDLLYHNFVSLSAFLSQDEFDESKLLNLIDTFNNFEVKTENYFSLNFGNKYFSSKNAKKIGKIREEIEQLFLKDYINLKEKFILLTSLNYAIDKIANTVGHYDAYIKKDINEVNFKLQMLDTSNNNNVNNKIYNQDANVLIRNIKCDILYIDPPYNSRQYSDAYHLLENLTLWKKPKVFGVSSKFDRTNIKSGYNKIVATKLLNDLIQNAKCKYILLSYNNMGNKGNSRSNAKIRDEDIMQILKKKGKVKIFEQKHKEFTAGKEKRCDNTERVFFTEVKI